mgnify:CR=1 FL=1|tara:strand:+ start:90 stop:710 length:621 start_codon:yes stop_codon:yes gene_type:complete
MESRIDALFPTALYLSVVNDFQNIQKELDDCIDDIEFEIYNNKGKTHYLSDPTFKSNLVYKYNLKYFIKELDVHLKNYLQAINIKIESGFSYSISESWMTKFTKGDYGRMHNHGGYDISGCYYYKTSGHDGNIFFESPASQHSDCFMHKGTYNQTYAPIKGGLLLFPGWINHGICENITDNIRMSLSFNITIKQPDSSFPWILIGN